MKMESKLYSVAILSCLLLVTNLLTAGTIQQSFSYDAAGRLIQVMQSSDAAAPTTAELYSYDASGNIIEKVVNGETVRMTYDAANQLQSRTDAQGTVLFVYDSAGRLIEERSAGQVIAAYEYGYLDKVVQVKRGDQVTQFHYNARGMLVAKERDGQIIETFGWDGIGLLAKNDTVYANEAHISGGVPLAAIDASDADAELQYFDSDYLGTTTAAYSANGAVDAKLVSSLGAGTEAEGVRFTGKPYDVDLDAHVFPYRNYRADVGRWASADPAGFPDGPNQHYYACVPTISIDPMGLVTYKTITGTGTYNEYDFFVQNFEYNYSFTYSESNGSTASGSVKSELSMTNTGIAVEVGIAVSQLNTSSVTVNTSWIDDGANSSLDQSVGGVTASQFVPTIPDGWAFDTWITSPVNNQTDLRDSGWANDTFPSGAQWRSKGVFTDYDYAYSYQIFEL